MRSPQLAVRRATTADLPAINRVIESAILNWPTAQRTKRLAVSVSQYDAVDLDDYEIFVCTHRDEILGIAAWDPDYDGSTGLLHGLYVLPIVREQGIGKRLMQTVFEAASTQRQTGVLVKAQGVSAGFFEHCELEPVEGDTDDYPHRFFKAIPEAA